MRCSVYIRNIRPVLLHVAIVGALWPCTDARAGNVPPDGTLTIDGQNLAGENWSVQARAELNVINGSAVGNVTVTNGRFTLADSTVTGAASGLNAFGINASNGATVTIDRGIVSAGDVGLALSSRTSDGQGLSVHATVTGSDISGGNRGASLTANAVLDVVSSTVSGTGSTSTGLVLGSGTVTLSDASTVTGQASGAQIMAVSSFGVVDTGRTLVVDGSVVRGVNGSAIEVSTRTASNPTSANIVLRNGATLLSGNGIAIDMGATTSTDIVVSASDIVGDIVAAESATARLGLQDAATLTGRIDGDVSVGVASGSAWKVGAMSRVSSLALDGGTLQLGTPGGPANALGVNGDLTGTGGVVVFNTELNAGGALASQSTDRLLIEGNVGTTNPTELVVAGTGAGALTDTNGNGVFDPGEGISLVQVGGTSRSDAFALRGGYVAAGPWQYTLQAFGPGEVDQAQNALAGGPLNWDYRLGNLKVCEGDDCEPVTPVEPPVDPVDPPVEPPVEPPVDPDPGEGIRDAVVPQVPSYLSAPAALLTYGDMLNDGLHQRLGELRTGASNDPVGGEVFARYLGGQLRYTSNLSFERFGYDFDQQVNALQLGGSLIALDGDNGSLRAGWAADHGTTRVTPKAVDGESSAKYRANGMSAWVTWQRGSGLWVDGVIGATRYRGDVGTDLRGADVARLRANGWTMSVEAGMPLAIGGDWTVEPRFQLKHQQLNFRNFTDADGLDVRLGTAKQTSARVGARVSRMANPKFMPYAGLDLTHTSNGDPSVDVSSMAWNVSDRFGSGRVGNAYRVSAGAVSQLTDHVQVYGEGNYQHFVGSYGMRGWAGNVGVRVTF